MVLLIIGAWLAFLWILIKVGIFKGWSLWMKLSPIAIYLAYFLIIAIPMNFTAPKGAVMVLRESVEINPAVSGTVTEILVESGQKIQAGTPLFKIDSAPYEARVASLEARLALSQTRLDQARELMAKQAGREFDVQTYAAELAQVRADLEAAQWNLEQTTVRAPGTGFVPHLSLQPGTQVGPPPTRAVISFIKTGEAALAVKIGQAYIRHVEPGQKVDVVLKLFPGQVHQATVLRVLNANSQGQLSPSGVAFDGSNWTEQPFLVALSLGDSLEVSSLPAGAFGTAAIYTSGMGSLGELIRAIMLRTETWLNFL